MRFAPLAFACGILASGLAIMPALAATSTTSFAVTATVLSSCMASTPVTAFGSNPIAGGAPASVTCTSPTQYSISLDAAGTDGATTELVSSANVLLNHTLLSNSEHTSGRALKAGTKTIAGMRNRNSLAYAYYSQTAQAQRVSSGAFSDAITVTITY